MISRFAPSPTGRLHAGHAWSALFAAAHGKMILRIEDIDGTRCRPDYVTGIYHDMEWLGLSWPKPVRIQSHHMDDYASALGNLSEKGLLYPCFCTRKDILDSPGAPHGPEGILYPGFCRTMDAGLRAERMISEPYALRIDMSKALNMASKDLQWQDLYRGWRRATPEILGDVVLARKDTPASYHLCVTLDDHIQNVTHVTRGEDLFHATHLHRLLQDLLGLNVPAWAHHPLLLDEQGRRFAKRDKSVTLDSLRASGMTSDEVINMIRSRLPDDGPWRGILDDAR